MTDVDKRAPLTDGEYGDFALFERALAAEVETAAGARENQRRTIAKIATYFTNFAAEAYWSGVGAHGAPLSHEAAAPAMHAATERVCAAYRTLAAPPLSYDMRLGLADGLYWARDHETFVPVLQWCVREFGLSVDAPLGTCCVADRLPYIGFDENEDLGRAASHAYASRALRSGQFDAALAAVELVRSLGADPDGGAPSLRSMIADAPFSPQNRALLLEAAHRAV